MFEWHVRFDVEFNGWRWSVSDKHGGEVVATGFVPKGTDGYREAVSRANSACHAHNTGEVRAWNLPLFAG